MRRNKQFSIWIWIGILSVIFITATYGQVEQNSATDKSEQSKKSEQPDSWIQKLEKSVLGEADFLEIEYTEVNDDGFLELQLRPNEDSNKFGVEFATLLNVSSKEEEGELFTTNRKELTDPLSAPYLVRYLRYGHADDPFYIRFGEFQHITIGRGFIMKNYSNHKHRGLHLSISSKEKQYGIETLINDFRHPTIVGGRLFAHPLQASDISLLSKIEVGMTEFIDIKPDRNENPLVAMGGDVSLPLINEESGSLHLYTDFALMDTRSGNESAEGITVGLGSRIRQIAFINVKGHIFQRGFRSTLFDRTYDMDKMEMGEYEDWFRMGTSGMIALSMDSKINFYVTLDGYADGEPELYVGVIESTWLEDLSFRAFYTRRNIRNINDPGFIESLFPDARSELAMQFGWETDFGLKMGWKFNIIALYERRLVQPEDKKPSNKFSLQIGANPE